MGDKKGVPFVASKGNTKLDAAVTATTVPQTVVMQESPPPPERPSAPSEPLLKLHHSSNHDAKQVSTGIYLTFCGCWICIGRTCGEAAQDCASCVRGGRRACANSTAFYIFAAMLWFTSVCIFVIAATWSGAYYNRHYSPTYKSLKINATKLNGTALQEAKEKLQAWKDDPMWDYFPMQKRYYIPGIFVTVAIVFAALQTFEKVHVDRDSWGLENDLDERHCYCCMRAVVLGSRICSMVWWVLGGSMIMGYLIMAVSFIDTLEEKKHAIVPVMGISIQCFLMSISLACVYIGKWMVYRETIRNTREGMEEDELESKIM